MYLNTQLSQPRDFRRWVGFMPTQDKKIVPTFCVNIYSFVIKVNICQSRVLLNRAPTSTQLHPPTRSSTQLHPPPPSSFQPPPSSLQHPQQYLNQNIARNWAISPNLGRKIRSCPF